MAELFERLKSTLAIPGGL